MIIDKQGRLAGKVSLIDIALILIVIGLIIGLGYRRLSQNAVQIVTSDTKFYVTLVVEPIRQFSLEAINEGDIFYKQHEQQPLGKVTRTDSEPAREIIKRPDGTPLYVTMEEKYSLYMTLECTGNVSDKGYFVNGNAQISEGSDLIIQSNKVVCGARVDRISESLGG
ncbi:MAG: DUF4330 domain-containing protein [Clostridiales bacterium]|nr:DUF4330 domain-containing protein [Clostridiales bacterium]